ncbi:unnamed protein product [Hapterophycus canaliculatus]
MRRECEVPDLDEQVRGSNTAKRSKAFGARNKSRATDTFPAVHVLSPAGALNLGRKALEKMSRSRARGLWRRMILYIRNCAHLQNFVRCSTYVVFLHTCLRMQVRF